MNYLIFGWNNCEYKRLRFKFYSGNVPDFPSYGEACERISQISEVFLHFYVRIPFFERRTWILDSNRSWDSRFLDLYVGFHRPMIPGSTSKIFSDFGFDKQKFLWFRNPDSFQGVSTLHHHPFPEESVTSRSHGSKSSGWQQQGAYDDGKGNKNGKKELVYTAKQQLCTRNVIHFLAIIVRLRHETS